LGSWFFSPFRRVFFAVSFGFFAVSTPANMCKGRKIQNFLTGGKACPQQ
jgi:hypothetical protein